MYTIVCCLISHDSLLLPPNTYLLIYMSYVAEKIVFVLLQSPAKDTGSPFVTEQSFTEYESHIGISTVSVSWTLWVMQW